MDPNVTLDDLRRAFKDIANKEDCEAYWLFKSLDGWMSRGGFLPDAWRVQLRGKP